ncbi:E3 UFM1-protein ligase 1 [Phytophthora cactorum]|nr:E3 UFM1-protein ligase 1 [Phytophthora cactorum]
MDEIALLQQQLAAVQQQEAALKLSDHNVIDLLLKLQQLGKLQVIHTRTGKQFLTPLQVQREIADYVALHGGRLSLTELEKLIDVDRTHVEKQAAALCRGSRSKDTYHLVNNGEELLTSWYLDGIMEDTDVLLQESGTTSIGDLAQQFGFAVDHMRDVVRTRLGSILKARERDNVLYTDSYVTAQKSRLEEFSRLSRDLSFGFDEAVANEALTELMQTKVLMGTLRGREYVPYVFMAAQREGVYSFFQQNGYLEHARARELQVARPYDFLKKRFPDAVPLQESVVSRTLQLQLEGAVEAAVNDNTFVDVRLLLPSALPAGDVALLLGMSPALEKAGMSPRQKFGEDATTKASRAATQQKSRAVQADVRETRQEVEVGEDSDVEDFGSKRGKKGKRGKGGNKRDQEESGGRSGKPGKGKKGKRGSKRGGDGGDNDGSKPVSTQASIVPSREETIELLDLEGDDDFMDGMVSYLEPKINELYSAALTKALSSIIRGDAASLRELRKTFEDQFDEQFTKLLVLEKGFNKLSMQVDAKDAAGMEQLALVETHVLESSAVELAALVTSFMAESNSLELEDVPYLSSSSGSEEEKTIKVLESNLPQSTASALVRLWTLATAGRRSLSDFTVHVPVLAEALSMPLRKLDRKKERQVIFSYRQTTLAELDDKQRSRSKQPALSSILFFQQLTGLPISFPRGTVSYGEMVLKAFQDSVPEKAASTIQGLVNLANSITSDEDAVEEQKSNWGETLDAARALILVKDLNSVE